MKSYFSFQIIKGTSISNLIILLINLLQGVLLARFLGPEGRGAVIAIIMLPSLFAGIFSFGANSGIGIISAKIKNTNILYPTVVLFSLVSSVIGMLIAYILIPYFLDETTVHLLPIINTFLLFIVFNHITKNVLAIEQGKGNFKLYNLLRTSINPIYLILLIFLYFFGIISVKNVIISLLTANAVIMILSLLIVIKNIKGIKKGVKLFPFKEIINKSIPFGVADLSTPIYLYLDKILILWFIGTVGLGYYTVAQSASNVLTVVSSSIATISFTQIATDKNNYLSIVRVFRIVAIVYVFFGLILGFLLPLLIPIAYGEEFKYSVIPAIILIIAAFFQGQGNILEQSLRGNGKAFVGLEARFVNVLVMLFLGYFSAKIYGLNGFVISFVLSQLIFLKIMIYRFKRNFQVEVGFFPKKNDFIFIFDYLYNFLKRFK
jgi:O-antigen/teichoic acid export membrane protein